MELKETKEGTEERSDFRWRRPIQRSPRDPDLYWRVYAQYGDSQRRPRHGSASARAAPVPIDEWFKLEVFWKSGLT